MHVVTDDQSKWRGVVGIMPGQLVQASASASGNNAILYTVPANRTLYITWYSASTFRSSNVSSGYGAICKPSGSILLRLGMAGGSNSSNFGQDVSLTIPLVVLSGYSVRVYSDTGGWSSLLSFQGYLV